MNTALATKQDNISVTAPITLTGSTIGVDLSSYSTTAQMNTALATKMDTFTTGHGLFMSTTSPPQLMVVGKQDILNSNHNGTFIDCQNGVINCTLTGGTDITIDSQGRINASWFSANILGLAPSFQLNASGFIDVVANTFASFSSVVNLTTVSYTHLRAHET